MLGYGRKQEEYKRKRLFQDEEDIRYYKDAYGSILRHE